MVELATAVSDLQRTGIIAGESLTRLDQAQTQPAVKAEVRQYPAGTTQGYLPDFNAEYVESVIESDVGFRQLYQQWQALNRGIGSLFESSNSEGRARHLIEYPSESRQQLQTLLDQRHEVQKQLAGFVKAAGRKVAWQDVRESAALGELDYDPRSRYIRFVPGQSHECPERHECLEQPQVWPEEAEGLLQVDYRLARVRRVRTETGSLLPISSGALAAWNRFSEAQAALMGLAKKYDQYMTETGSPSEEQLTEFWQGIEAAALDLRSATEEINRKGSGLQVIGADAPHGQ